MKSVRTMLYEIAPAQGWGDTAIIELLSAYIDAQGHNETLEDYLLQVTETELDEEKTRLLICNRVKSKGCDSYTCVCRKPHINNKYYEDGSIGPHGFDCTKPLQCAGYHEVVQCVPAEVDA